MNAKKFSLLGLMILVFLGCKKDDECVSNTDTYSINLNASDCTVDIQTTLGVSSEFTETVSGTSRNITANAIANHNVGTFPNSNNPNTISEQNLSYSIPANPSLAGSSTSLINASTGMPAYAFGILRSGVKLDPIAAEYWENPETGQLNTAWNESALSSNVNLGTDCNNAHAQPSGNYHYHATPSAYIANLNVNGTAMVDLGYAADGFTVYYKYGHDANGNIIELTPSYQLRTGERGGDGESEPDGCYDGTYVQDYIYVDGLGDLDECNGYTDPFTGDYYYVITDGYPSIPRCFMGTPSTDFQVGP